MRRLLLILLLLQWVHVGFAKEPLDSVYWTEMEDSVSSLFIKPIQKPEKLLKRIIERLKFDMQQKHEVKKYEVGAYFSQGTLLPFATGCAVSAEAGVGLEKVKVEEFSYDGPYQLALQDSSRLRDFLLQFATLSPVHAHKAYREYSKAMSPLTNYKETLQCYDMAADSIGDAAGRSLLRFRFTWKKEQRKGFDKEHYNGNISGLAYFDCRSLQLKQFKGVALLPSFKYVTRLLYRIDYDEKGRTPVVKQINIFGTKDDMEMKAAVRRISK